MSKIWIPGGGGGADLDVVTAGAGDVLSGKVIVDKNGEPLTGTMPNKTGTALTVATNGKTLIPQGYHDGTQYAKNTQATLAGGTLTPSTSQVTVSCNGKLMTSNYVIPAFSLPSASIILSGQKVTIYGKTVTGTAQIYTQTSTDVDANANGVTKLSGDGTFSMNSSGLDVSTGNTTEGIARTNNAFNLTNYKYVKVDCPRGALSNTQQLSFRVGVSSKTNGSGITWGAKIIVSYGNRGTAIVDVTNLSGMYYIYFGCHAASDSTTQKFLDAPVYISNT